MKMNLETKKFNQLNGENLVLFADSKNNILETDKAFSKEYAQYDIGKKKTITSFLNAKINGFKNLYILGLGEISDLSTEDVRRLAAVCLTQLKSHKAEKINIALPISISKKIDQNSFLDAFVQGLSVCNFAYDENLTATKNDKTLNLTFSNIKDAKKAKESLNNAEVMSEQINFARQLGDAPGNLMTPTILANEVVKMAKTTSVKVTVWDKARIKKEKMGGLLGVAAGSDQEPKFIIMEYHGAGKSKTPICLVGKGLTFDAGGISIKPGAGMDEMKYDMCGSAAVIAAIMAISKLKLKVNVIALVPSTENLLGGSATKPGDILKFRNGKTAEILNTDAEGRLILADALSYATELKPQAIFDAATLTGAMVVALGNSHTGFFTKNDKLAEKIIKAGEASEEPLWRMPLTSEHTDDIKGVFADLSNIGATRGAGSATAAAFLAEFVDEKIPYAHFDIAGTAWNCGKRREYLPAKGATGVMVRSFVEIAKTYI